MLNSTTFVVVMFFSIVIVMAVVPLLNSAFLNLFTRLLKFKEGGWKKAIQCSYINLGIFIAINSVYSVLFIGKVKQVSPFFTMVSFLVSFVIGTYVVKRFYKESTGKSFLALFLTGLVMVVLFVIIAIVASLILGPYLLKGGVLK